MPRSGPRPRQTAPAGRQEHRSGSSSSRSKSSLWFPVRNIPTSLFGDKALPLSRYALDGFIRGQSHPVLDYCLYGLYFPDDRRIGLRPYHKTVIYRPVRVVWVPGWTDWWDRVGGGMARDRSEEYKSELQPLIR